MRDWIVAMGTVARASWTAAAAWIAVAGQAGEGARTAELPKKAR